MIEILEEPAGEVYRTLIDHVGRGASSFSLVWRDELGFDDDAAEVEAAL